MADNFPETPGSGRNVATDQVTYSGDTADVQLMRPVLVTGSEGSKTVIDLPGDATNGLKVNPSAVGVVSTANSSTATLTSGSVFTGTGEDVSEYMQADVSVFSDQASANAGLELQQSSDGTNWDFVDLFPNTSGAVLASIGLRVSVNLLCKFFRVKYTNGGTNQGSFRLQTIYKKVSNTNGRADFLNADTPAAAGMNRYGPGVAALNYAWSPGNGDWVRNKTVEGGFNIISGDGLQAAAIVAQFDDTGTTTATENRFNPLRTSSRRELYTQIRDAAGNERGANVTANKELNVIDANSSSALTALQLIDDPVFADEASFTTATSKVMVAGIKTATSGSAPDDAGGADRAVSPIATRNRVPFVIGGDPGVITVKHTTITTAVTDAAIVTISTGNKIVVTRISVTLDNASTVFPTLLIGFGTANTPTTTGVLVAHGGVPAGGGITIGDGSGILGIGADNEDLRVTTTGNATGNGLQIVVTYFLVVA